ncbi:MAG TPA: hypothetical protein VJ734_01220 [Nitrosospira sp.]|nr:hypothetical protein [Nitrosospira sp.]
MAVATLRRWHRQGRLASCRPYHGRPSALCVGNGQWVVLDAAADISREPQRTKDLVDDHDRLLLAALPLAPEEFESAGGLMQATTQTRLHMSEETGCPAALRGASFMALYACVAAGRGKAIAYKTEFCRAHGIPARLFNAIALRPARNDGRHAQTAQGAAGLLSLLWQKNNHEPSRWVSWLKRFALAMLFGGEPLRLSR